MNKVVIKTPIQSDFLPVVTGIHHQAEFIKFAIWYGTPSQFRKPKNQKEFADSVGVCVDTLTDWKKHPQFSFFVWEMTKEWIRDHVPDVIGGLYTKASSEKTGAGDTKLFLRLAGIEVKNDKR